MRDDPHEAGTRLAAFAKDPSGEAFLAALNASLAHADLPGPECDADPASLPLVYIVGAPRSGTTLASQLASRYLPVGYIDNLVARFWRRPSAGIRLSRLLTGTAGREAIGFESRHGVTAGVAGPHEFGYFWRHWLRLDDASTHHLAPDALARVDAAGLRHALEAEILAAFGTPAVFKNVICGFHAAFLSGLHPRSLFVHIERDAYDTCASILRSRMERYGSYTRWWSLKPSTWPFDTAPGDAAAEVARQVLDCRVEITRELASPGVRSLRLAYADMCADPAGTLRKVCTALAPLGARIEPHAGPMPALAASGSPPLPPALAARLRECLPDPA